MSPRVPASPTPALAARPSVLVGLVAAVTAIAFWPALQNGFVNLDDHANVVDNEMFRGFAWTNLAWMATTFHMGHWQPLSWLSLAFDHAVWGLDPAGYHLTNVALHVINAVLVAMVGERLLAAAGMSREAAWRGAVIGALLWAVHPLRVESVAWVTERRDVLSGSFTLLALLAYVSPETRWRLPAVLLAMALAIAAKASAMVLPALFVLLDVYPLQRLRRGGSRAVWIEKIPIVALAAAGAGMALAAQRAAEALAPLDVLGWWSRAGAAMVGLGFYLEKTVLPTGLMPLHEYPVDMGPSHPQALAGIVVFGAALAGSLALLRRSPGFAAALAAYVIALAPTLGLAQSGPQLVADRYSYLALLGPSLAIGALVASIASGWRLVVLAATVAVVLAGAAFRQTMVWRDSETLWRHALAVEPRNAHVHANLGAVAALAGASSEAERRFREAIALRPDLATTHLDLAGVLARQGRLPEALAACEEAIGLRPQSAPAHLVLGMLLRGLGRDDEAIRAYQQSLALDPGQLVAHAELGDVLAGRGRVDEALREYDLALAIRPTAIVLNNKAQMLQRMGRSDEAVGLMRDAIRSSPEDPRLHENLAHALLDTGDRAGAMRALEDALRFDPQAEQPRRTLAELRGRP